MSTKEASFWTGCLVFVAFSAVLSIIMPIYVKTQTTDKTQTDTNMR